MMFVMIFYLLILHPLIALVLLIVSSLVHSFQIFMLMFMDQFEGGVSVEKKTCDTIYDDYVQELTSE